MKYDLQQKHEIKKMYLRLKQLVKKGALTEVLDKSKRSRNQNNYQHLLFAAFALEYGCSLDYAKQVIYKEIVCPEVFMYKRPLKNDDIIEEKRSTRDIPKETTTMCIKHFKEWSAKEAGIPLPDATDQGWLRQIELEAARMSHYLK